MLKLILSAALTLAITSVAIADSSKSENKVNLPTIIKNELVKPGMCLLTFAEGGSKEVPCTHSAEAQ